ncbi:MAG: hypothetical protein RL660_2197 [Bacteroidota bacterium]|jgi:hypothetical protein
MLHLFFGLCLYFLQACESKATGSHLNAGRPTVSNDAKATIVSDSGSYSDAKTIHIFVALCDNVHQGIVPVPATIGNGQVADKNLYWGAAYGIYNFFAKQKEWKLLERAKVDSTVLERAVFRHVAKPYVIVADAYDGRAIKRCTEDLLAAASGKRKKATVMAGDATHYRIHSDASMLVYIGHNGLMDFSLQDSFTTQDSVQRDVCILACASKAYFSKYLKAANAKPLLWTSNLMCPEAYTIHAAINAYIDGASAENIHDAAAASYAKYQKCSKAAAKNLIVSGY